MVAVAPVAPLLLFHDRRLGVTTFRGMPKDCVDGVSKTVAEAGADGGKDRGLSSSRSLLFVGDTPFGRGVSPTDARS
jgi:hypothetical protein